jgi:hypothetical protein
MVARKRKPEPKGSKPGTASTGDVSQKKLGLKEATGTENENLQLRLANQVLNALWIPPDAPDQTKLELYAAAVSQLKGIKPADELEGMLAAQAVATHSAAMECLRRAMLPNQSIEGRDMNLRHAAKLLNTYSHQIEVLDKHRGKGQQQVTVKYVNVESGGQAVVGNVRSEARPPKPEGRSASPPALPDQSGTVFEMDPVQPKQKSAVRRRRASGRRSPAKH